MPTPDYGNNCHRPEGQAEEGSSPSDGELTLVERALLDISEEIHKLKKRITDLEIINLTKGA